MKKIILFSFLIGFIVIGFGFTTKNNANSTLKETRKADQKKFKKSWPNLNQCAILAATWYGYAINNGFSHEIAMQIANIKYLECADPWNN